MRVELSVMMCDIDSFKSINDGYGHAVGDRAIAATAAFLATLYPKAAVYRYGGDEFLLILRDGGEAASVCLNRRKHMLPIQGGTLPIQISMGAVSGAGADVDALLRLIAEADRKLYGEKETLHGQGRGHSERREG